LYFKPVSKAVIERCESGEVIAQELFGRKWKEKMGFPKYELVPEKYEWADFRVGHRISKKSDWVAKIYGHEINFHFTGQEFLTDGRLAKYYKTDDARVVCLARWNSPDLLEMRVTRSESRALMLLRLNALWTRLKPALQTSDFIEWDDLKKARKKMLKFRSKYTKLYQTGSIQVTDSASGKAAFLPYTEDEASDDTEERRTAIDAFVAAGCSCEHLVATWQPSNGLAHELRTIIGARYPHEIVISGQTSSQAVDYVTDKLRFFSR
jgi:hypothetical protein